MRRRLMMRTLTIAATALTLWGMLGGRAALLAQAAPGMAPGQPAALTVEAVLPEVLRAYYGPPYDLAALRFGPELWAALSSGEESRSQANRLQMLFRGGMLFGVGPLRNWLALAEESAGAGRADVRWAAPPTMRASVHLQIGQTEFVITGQRADWVRRAVSDTGAENLLNQLELLWFPLVGIGGQAVPVDLAQGVTLVVTGLAPGATQTFGWDFGAPQILDMPEGPQIVQRGAAGALMAGAPNARLSQRTARLPGARAAPAPDGGGLGGAGLGGMVGAPAEGPTALEPEAMAAAGAQGAPGPAGPAGPGVGQGWQPLIVPPAAGMAFADAAMGIPLYPQARTALTVGVDDLVQGNAGRPAFLPAEAAAGVNQIIEDGGMVVLDYWTNPVGRQEVDVVAPDGQVVERLSAGPASPTGEGMAPWRPARSAARSADMANLAFSLRNTVETPQGAQVSEALVPVPGLSMPAMAPTSQTPGALAATDLTLSGLSVLGEVLSVRVTVPILTNTQPVLPLGVVITDEEGRVVRTLQPALPAPGHDYVFGWDCTDQAGNRVPDGRYPLRIGTRAQSPQGVARSEVRYWVDVPLSKTERRLALLGPARALSLQPQLEVATPEKATFTYVVPARGQVTVLVLDGDGRLVRRLLDEEAGPGPHRVAWDGRDERGQLVPPGSYSVQFELEADDRGGWGVVAMELPLLGR